MRSRFNFREKFFSLNWRGKKIPHNVGKVGLAGFVDAWNALQATAARVGLDRWADRNLHVEDNELYDGAMDRVYNSLSADGGGLHRIFDGNHDVFGAWAAIRKELPDDSFIQEFKGLVAGLWNDMITPNGIPLVTLDHEQYARVIEMLEEFGVSRGYVADMVTYTGAELLGAISGFGIVLLAIRERDSERYRELAGQLGVLGAASANPILLSIALLSAIAGYRMVRQQKLTNQDLRAPWYAVARGSVIAVATIAGALVGALLLGPIGAFALALGASYFARKKLNQKRREKAFGGKDIAGLAALVSKSESRFLVERRRELLGAVPS